MKTQEIEVTNKATVPEGDLCYHRSSEIFCEKLGETRENLPGLSKSMCSFFNNTILEETIDRFGQALTVTKCRACLDACANGTERALKELAE